MRSTVTEFLVQIQIRKPKFGEKLTFSKIFGTEITILFTDVEPFSVVPGHLI